jgi:hypothetical protein
MHAQNRLATGSTSYNGSNDAGVAAGAPARPPLNPVTTPAGPFVRGVPATKSFVRFPPIPAATDPKRTLVLAMRRGLRIQPMLPHIATMG